MALGNGGHFLLAADSSIWRGRSRAKGRILDTHGTANMQALEHFPAGKRYRFKSCKPTTSKGQQ